MRIKKQFAPTVITIESEEDLKHFLRILDIYINTREKTLFGVSRASMTKEEPALELAKILYTSLEHN